MITPIKAFKLSDGRIFEDQSKAEAEDETLKFREWYEDNRLTHIDADEMLEWLQDKKDRILLILGRKTNG